MNRTKAGISAAVTVILIVSLAFNFFLVIKYTDLAKRQNTMWSNAITHLTQVINWVSINSGDLVNDQREWKYRLSESRTNLRLVQEQLENTNILPYAGQIFPWEQMEKVRLFINYNFEVIRLMEQELENKGTISTENKERIQVIHNTWEQILGVLETERNQRDPFRPVFTSAAWSPVFEKAVAVFDRVEIIPLPEK